METSPLENNLYLLDTHALFQWVTREEASASFISFFDEQVLRGRVLISSISFWEFGLLAKSGRLSISNIQLWKEQVLKYSHARIISPGIDEMIDSTLLPPHHKDPFDRLLIIQALTNKALLVTQDLLIKKYRVKIFWKQ